LKERPAEIDLFKAIFEDEDEEEEEDDEEAEEEEVKSEEVVVDAGLGSGGGQVAAPEVVASSIGGINVKDISRYLSRRDDEDEARGEERTEEAAVEKIVFRKPTASGKKAGGCLLGLDSIPFLSDSF